MLGFRVWKNTLSRRFCPWEACGENRLTWGQNTGKPWSYVIIKHWNLTMLQDRMIDTYDFSRYGFQTEERNGGGRKSWGIRDDKPITPPVTYLSVAALAQASISQSLSPQRQVYIISTTSAEFTLTLTMDTVTWYLKLLFSDYPNSVLYIRLHVGTIRHGAHQHIQRPPTNAKLHDGQQPAYASRSHSDCCTLTAPHLVLCPQTMCMQSQSLIVWVQ